MGQNRRSTVVTVPRVTLSIEASAQREPFGATYLTSPQFTYTEIPSTAAKRLTQEARARTRQILALTGVAVLLSVLACWIAGGKCY
jgi:hypothetical protein